MASPQKEDGYTAIANEIMDALCRIRIPGEERQILDTILRKTYGWHKVEDDISLSQFVENTGLKKPNVIRAIKGLLSKKIICIIKKDNAFAQAYRFNKNYEEWQPLSKKITLSKKIISVIGKDNPSLSKKIPTKETTTKETLTKEKAHRKKAVLLPLPKGFSISERVQAWAIKKNHTCLDLHLENFILVCTAKGYQYADWDSAFMNAIRNNWAKIGDNGHGTTTSGAYRTNIRGQVVPDEQANEIQRLNERYYAGKAAEKASGGNSRGVPNSDDAPDFQDGCAVE